MAWVTTELLDTWKAGQFVGEHTPSAVVQVQLGHYVRGWYRHDENVDGAGRHIPRVKASIWGEGGYATSDAKEGHWSAQWVPNTPFYDVPNLSSIKRTKDLLGAKGVQVLEVTLDALDYVPKVGALGDAYHAIVPGWLAPGRSYVGPSRGTQRWQEPDELSPWAPADGDPRISDSVAIRVWQGFGQPQTDDDENCPPADGGRNGAWVFRGLIDAVDIDGDPNTITITARTGKLLTDQRLFRASKSVQLKDPITFYDREAARKATPVASGARASSHTPMHPATQVLDRAKDDFNPNAAAYKTTWRSSGAIGPGTLEWVEVRLPQGNYDQAWMVSAFGQMAYLGIHAQPLSHWVNDGPGSDLVKRTSPPTMDGEPIPTGWVDLGHTVPGGDGGWPYIRAFNTGSTAPSYPRGGDGRVIDNPIFNHVFELGERSILRVGFTAAHPFGSAEVSALFGMRRYGVQRDIRQQQFILVDDATEIIKIVLRWAGYHQWDIEDARVRLSDGTNYGPGVVAKSSGRLTFNRSSYLIDVITALAKELGWVFFIADPTDMHSEGVPTFRRDSSLIDPCPVVSITDTTMLTGLKVNRSDENRPAVIRVRGKTASVRGGGAPLGGDSVRRLMAVYFPPWWQGSRSAGVLRHIVYQDDQFVSYAQVLYAAFLIALNSALAIHTATAEIPGLPLLELDDQVSIVDEATGTNSRLWVVQSTDEMQLGQNATWRTTLQGSLLDTQDLQEVLAQINGKAPFFYGVGTVTKELARIDWNRVKNPVSGHVSRYPSPTIKGKRTPRVRSAL